MSYHDLLHMYGSEQDSAETRVYIYCQKPAKLKTVGEVMYMDRDASDKIKRLEALIADLKDYRQALAARYAELETMPYTYRLELHRHPAWGIRGVTYELLLVKLYQDGTKTNEWAKSYTGAERRAALKMFDQIKLERPGIEASLDIEKRQWEK